MQWPDRIGAGPQVVPPEMNSVSEQPLLLVDDDASCRNQGNGIGVLRRTRLVVISPAQRPQERC